MNHGPRCRGAGIKHPGMDRANPGSLIRESRQVRKRAGPETAQASFQAQSTSGIARDQHEQFNRVESGGRGVGSHQSAQFLGETESSIAGRTVGAHAEVGVQGA